jgi:ADP-dependent NAD(P)H-hydrate dehydratase / NAD(P)H-hydrate epimerase
MKIFATNQIAAIDAYTIENEPIADIDLMERAAAKVSDWIKAHFSPETSIAIFAGPGNNGGDAMVVARLLAIQGYPVDLFFPDFERKMGVLPEINLKRLDDLGIVRIISFKGNSQLPNLNGYHLIVDGLFGSGLTRQLNGFASKIIKHINRSGIKVISIDVPSGLMGEESHDPLAENVIKADYTLSFQFPKLSFMFRENEEFIGQWEILPIGLHNAITNEIQTFWHYLDRKTAASLVMHRKKFSHKGTFGHALLVAGSRGKMGAAVLAARGCLRSGAGLLSVHLPRMGNNIIQTALPEAMVCLDNAEDFIEKIPSPSNYRAVAIGPGIGNKEETAKTFHQLLQNCAAPLVIDADGLNILSEYPEWLDLLQPNDIITPHPLEFARLIGKKASSDYERLQQAGEFSRRFRIIVVLKGANTAIIFPDGNIWFNSTGNAGMATAGSGDVLTGILLGLLSQGYSPQDAARLGVYLHGFSADLWVESSSEESLLAGDIADNLGKAFAELKRIANFGE